MQTLSHLVLWTKKPKKLEYEVYYNSYVHNKIIIGGIR